MSIFDFDMIQERNPAAAGACAVNANGGQDQGILRKLINAPMVDSSVLKHIYHAFRLAKDEEQKKEEFHKMWKRHCRPSKETSLEELVDRFYDKVDSEKFDYFINQQKSNYLAGLELLEMEIAAEKEEYLASGLLRVSSLEKMMSLTVATRAMPDNFFPVFNYICSEQPELKAEFLSGIYNLHLIGYSPSLEIRFLSL